jgi:nicotinamidase-related amidase
MRLFTEASAWRRAHRIAPAASDRRNVHLLLIDLQKDFCFPEGTLYVGGRSGRGALEDSRRIAEFVYRNLDVLTNVTTTLDTHFAYQIFFPSFWLDRADAPLAPHREITTSQLDRGEVRPNPAVAAWLCDGDYPWLLKQVRHYTRALEAAGKYTLYLWPPHCLLGSDGHALAGVIQEARLFHSYVRVENYSALRPEVLTRDDGAPLAERNLALVRKLLGADAVVIAGQAASHCVKSTIEDLLEEIAARDAALAKKVYILEDCMSAVAVPDGKGGFAADFTPQAEAALQRFGAAGMHVVRSTDAIETWPELDLA